MLKQQGMALFQVLLMVAIISVLLLVMSQQTRSSIERAQAMQDQAELQLALESSANYVDALLLSNDWLIARNQPDHPLAGINFYNYPQTLRLPERAAYRPLGLRVTVQMQNEGSLLNVNFETVKLRQLLLNLGVNSTRVDLMITELRNWIQQPGQLFFQSFSDLAHLEHWDMQDVELIEPYTTLFADVLNPAWSPDEVLAILLTQGQADTIQALRKSNENAVGMLQEFIELRDALNSDIFPGRQQRMRITAEPEGLQLYRRIDYRSRHPIPLRLHAKHFQHVQ
ncbi:prepilin-type N-terminal cleavage/methylation domain-containing protein [Pseudidiomarina sp. 1APP75-27a]|uniref:hypothetical protein n=1 Tax=Pseudidiomarina terrestris TaxID=2820060 RepID=UPI002B05E68C|nr:hypothetical protein [Pseudidiomarina sp. 1APP75-27a]MEA3587714.1 prepilin-type N-terminal cleavage/methylation domain-containing protein [Pseudidiomarina sp. 1APP75-27a]